MSAPGNGAAKNLNDSRNQALQALISSLAPSGSSEENKLSEQQVSAISDRLSQILGSPGEGPEERRNERGELLNEEGLPIIDIAEPLSDVSGPSQSSKAFPFEHDPVPLSTLSEQDRLQLRARRDRILNMLEEEEERQSEKSPERERRRKTEELAKIDAESKAAAREMQKKLGKALLKNLAAQREQEEEEKKRTQEAAAAEACTQNGESSCRKPKKSVSFANVPDVDEVKPRPKPSAAWGDVCVAKLKAGVPRARLKAEVLSKQPMKLEVVERVPGVDSALSPEERDSDDESNPAEQDLETDEHEENEENTPPLDDDFEDTDESTRPGEDSEEDEYDLSQARIQREMALEYIRLRESIGAEAHHAMTSHTHGGEDEWDQPEVPLEATLSSKPSKGGLSRFKAARQANLAASGAASISLGASVLPQGKAVVLQRALRTGKLANGQLAGGEAGESESEDDQSENMKRMMEMLKDGAVVDNAAVQADIPSRMDDSVDIEKVIERGSPATSSSALTHPPNPTPTKASHFLAERAARKPPSEAVAGPLSSITSISLPLLSTVSERAASKRPAPPPSMNDIQSENGPSATDTAFKKPPTVISVPSLPPSQRRPFAAPLVKPDSTVLSSMIVESPSFPPPSASSQSASRPPPLVSEVRESTRRAVMTEEPTQRTGRVSRFKAERL